MNIYERLEELEKRVKNLEGDAHPTLKEDWHKIYDHISAIMEICNRHSELNCSMDTDIQLSDMPIHIYEKPVPISKTLDLHIYRKI